MTETKIHKHHEFIAKYLAWAEKGKEALTLVPFALFRGQADVNWSTLPSLIRIQTKLGVDQLKLIEIEVINEFRRQHQLKKETWDDMEVLAFARHHGAPTRLLDWTHNAMVALWFCVQDKKRDHLDGKIVSLNVFSNNSKIAPAIGDLWLETVEKFETGQRVLSFTVNPRTSRVKSQSSVFTIAAFTDGIALKSVENHFGVTANPLNPGVRELIVPSVLKPYLRKTLHRIGFDAFSIYGGADALGESISDKLQAFFEKSP